MPRAAIYVRLSQDEPTGEADTARKLQERVDACLALATRHTLTVDPKDIYVERQSGARLSTRPLVRALLEKCQERYYTHIVTPAVDRLTRGDAKDQYEIEECLLAGEIIVITHEQVIAFDDTYEDRHALPFEIMAVAAREYRRGVIRKIKAANEQRARDGKTNAGNAPYGYLWVSPPDSSRKSTHGHFEIDGELTLTKDSPAPHTPETYLALARRQAQSAGRLLDGVECTGGAYYWLCQMFERIQSDSVAKIAAWLQEEEAPLPEKKHKTASYRWNLITITRILRNPFYAGYPAKRFQTDRKGVKHALPREKWLFSEQEQPYPHPITLEKHEAICALLTSRSRRGNAPKTVSEHILTGVLKCSKGANMVGSMRNYTCRCYFKEHYCHAGSSAKKEKYERIAFEVVRDIVFSLPPHYDAPIEPDSTPLPPRSAISAKKQELANLQKARETMLRYNGEEAYQKAENALRSELAGLEEAYLSARSQKATQEARTVLSALAEVGREGFADLWEVATPQEKRELIALSIKEMRVVSAEMGKVRRGLRITVQPYFEEFYPSREIVTTRHS